jgi:DNA-binding Xre family transcriptional regulator
MLAQRKSPMSSKQRILSAIRFRMKKLGVTYAMVASKIGISESSVKRYFSEGRMSLDTVDELCQALDCSLEEMLADLTQNTEPQVLSFSEDQEALLAKNDLLFSIFYLVAGAWSYENIINSHSLSGAELNKALRELESAGLMRFQSNTTLQTLLPIDTPWRTDGPLWKKFRWQAVQEFFDSEFERKGEYLKVGLGPILPETAAVINRMMGKLQEEIKALIAIDKKNISNIKTVDGYWFVTAMRPMNFSVIRDAVLKSMIPPPKP